MRWCFRLGLVLFWVAATSAPVRAQDSSYMDLESVAAQLGMKAQWVESAHRMRLSSEWTRLDFTASSRIFELNGLRLYLGQPVLQSGGALYLSQKDFRYTLSPLLTPQIFPNPPALRRIVLDPGHGGKDPGGQNREAGLSEKDLTLTIAKKIQSRMEALGYEVRLTRDRDVFIPLAERAVMANRWKADLFLSLHFNAAHPSVRGVETFVYTLHDHPSSSRDKTVSADRQAYPGNANDPWNALIGFYIQRQLVKTTGLPDRGLKRARFSVLEGVRCPAALLELGFVTNAKTATLVQSEAWMDRTAEAVVEGVLFYQKTLTRLHRSATQANP